MGLLRAAVRRRKGGWRALFAVGLGVVLLAAQVQAVRAEQVVGPTSVTGVTVTAGTTGETHIILSFNRILPQFSIVANDIDKPVLGFADTVRGSGASVPSGVHGLLKDVQFDQRDTVLTMTLVASGPAHVEAKPMAGGHALDLTITPAKGVAQATPAGPTGPLPAYSDRDPDDDHFVVVPLRYADISEVVGILSAGQSIKSNDSFTPQEPAFGSSGMTGGGQPSNNLVPQTYLAGQQDAAPMGQMVDDSIGVDRRLNAIVLHGTAERIERLKEKIAEIDVPVASVQLETVFVELTDTAAKNIGIDYNNANGQIGMVTYQAGSFANGTGQSFSGTGYGSYNLQAAIYAQVQKGQGRILSKPRISAPSGGTAKIITGDALPILTSIALSGVNAVSQQVQYVNVGVTLQIAPRVGGDGYVTSHIFAEVSSVTGYSQGYPTISQREASTEATVRDGDYFVIGGLTQESHLTTKGKIPGFGDIPGLGEIFKLHQETASKTQLYIIVTPHVVTPEDAQAAKRDAAR